MNQIQPATPEFMAGKEPQEAKRRAPLLQKLGAEGSWKLQQEAITELASLRRDLAERHSKEAPK